MKMPQAIGFSLAWIVLALLFNTGIFFIEGHQKALEFLTGYLIELSLSIDNLFVFFLIFAHFKTEPVKQGQILYWGFLGAQLMRGVLIFSGVALLKNISWMMDVFGLILVVSGLKLFIQGEKSFDFKKFIPQGVSSLLVVLLTIELADLVFAFDSIPAVLAITKDPFIVYSSNIFAILGLRSMYFILAPQMGTFRNLHYALGIILVFVGLKMFLDPIWSIPTLWSLGIILTVLAGFFGITYLNKRGKMQ